MQGGSMGVKQKLNVLLFQAIILLFMYFVTIVSSSQHHMEIVKATHSANKDNNQIQVSPRLMFEITVHGFLLWASMGFLMPIGILAIRTGSRENNQTRLRVIFYVHAILQTLATLLATTGAIMSIKNFSNLFNNNHQRLGVALYGIIWLQLVFGIFRPQRGSKRRSVWFFAHWILGTAVSLLGVLAVYTGLGAYKEKTSKGTKIWNILFTLEISLIVLFYLFQEKWAYIQESRGVIFGNELITPTLEEISQDIDKKKILKGESC